MTVLWQPGFSKDGSALCMCVCTRVRVCVLHGTCSSYSVTNSLPNERQRISYFPLNFSGACSCSDQQTVTETMLCDFCGHSLFVTLSVAPSLSVFPLSLSFHFPRSFPSSLSACLFLAFSLPLSLYILSPLVEERMGDALMTKAFSPQKKNLLGEVVKTVFEFFE